MCTQLVAQGSDSHDETKLLSLEETPARGATIAEASGRLFSQRQPSLFEPV